MVTTEGKIDELENEAVETTNWNTEKESWKISMEPQWWYQVVRYTCY